MHQRIKMIFLMLLCVKLITRYHCKESGPQGYHHLVAAQGSSSSFENILRHQHRSKFIRKFKNVFSSFKFNYFKLQIYFIISLFFKNWIFEFRFDARSSLRQGYRCVPKAPVVAQDRFGNKIICRTKLFFLFVYCWANIQIFSCHLCLR